MNSVILENFNFEKKNDSAEYSITVKIISKLYSCPLFNKKDKLKKYGFTIFWEISMVHTGNDKFQKMK